MKHSDEEQAAKDARFSLGIVRGLQIAILFYGVYLALFEGRGWGAIFVAAICVLLIPKFFGSK